MRPTSLWTPPSAACPPVTDVTTMRGIDYVSSSLKLNVQFRNTMIGVHHETASHLRTDRSGRRINRHRAGTDGSCRTYRPYLHLRWRSDHPVPVAGQCPDQQRSTGHLPAGVPVLRQRPAVPSRRTPPLTESRLPGSPLLRRNADRQPGHRCAGHADLGLLRGSRPHRRPGHRGCLVHY